MMNDLQLYIPRTADGWFYVIMMSDPETMTYNAPWFPPDGCIPDPEKEWRSLQENWIGKEPERFYAFLHRKNDRAFVGDVNYHINPKQNWGIWESRFKLRGEEKGMALPDYTMLLKQLVRPLIIPTRRLDFGI